MFGSRQSALQASQHLLDHESQYVVASLRERFIERDEDGLEYITSDEPCESITSADVTSVTIKRLRAHYFVVRVEVQYELEGEPSFTPNEFSGQYDLPRITTYLNPDEDTNELHWYPSVAGEAFSWGGL
jgi:hypothetical protein